jgi:hypothetical protein
MSSCARTVARPMVMRASLMLVLLCASPARACWEGTEILSDRTHLVCVDCSWSTENAQMLATWAVRIEALLPAGYRVSVDALGPLTVCRAGHHRCSVVDESPPTRFDEVFDLVARALHASPATRARAERLEASVFAVTIGSFSSSERAWERAEWANAPFSGRWPYSTGIYWGDGSPSVSTIAHVEPHGVHHRVVAGLFLDLDDARALVRDLSRAGIEAAVVRP